MHVHIIFHYPTPLDLNCSTLNELEDRIKRMEVWIGDDRVGRLIRENFAEFKKSSASAHGVGMEDFVKAILLEALEFVRSNLLGSEDGAAGGSSL